MTFVETDPVERVLSKADRSGECWLWLGQMGIVAGRTWRHLLPGGAAAPGPRGRVRGEGHSQTHLTAADVVLIRQMRARGAHLKVIGERFGICATTAMNIARRKTWGHVA